MKKLYYFFVYAGEVLFVWSIIFVLSISFQSVVIKGKVEYGERCNQSFNDEFIRLYDYKGITFNHGILKCNTYYLDYNSELNEEENVVFLVSVSIAIKNSSLFNSTIIILSKQYAK